jgi:hypothetical protein
VIKTLSGLPAQPSKIKLPLPFSSTDSFIDKGLDDNGSHTTNDNKSSVRDDRAVFRLEIEFKDNFILFRVLWIYYLMGM